VELRLDVRGRLALVVCEVRPDTDGDLPGPVSRLVELMVADPPAIWPPPVIGTATRNGDRVAVRAGNHELGELACHREWWAAAAHGDTALLVVRCSADANVRCWYGGLEPVDAL
jgi:hypothetical protein